MPLILAFLMLFVINIGYNLFSSSEKLYSLQRTQKFNQMHYIEEIDTYFYTKSGKKLSDKKLRAIRSEITKSYIKNLYDKCYNGRIERNFFFNLLQKKTIAWIYFPCPIWHLKFFLRTLKIFLFSYVVRLRTSLLFNPQTGLPTFSA